MATEEKIPGTDEAWESRALGADPSFVAVSPEVDDAEIDAALELQPISIRLPKSLIEDYKLIAQLNGLGYQPLMRQVLKRFADAEKKRILREAAARVAKQRKASATEDDDASRTGTDG